LFILIIQPSHLYLPSSIFPHLLNFLRYSFRLAHLLTLLTSHLLSLHLLIFTTTHLLSFSLSASQFLSVFSALFPPLVYLFDLSLSKIFSVVRHKVPVPIPLSFSQQSRHDPVTAHHFRWKLINLCTRT
jgi:hypothetical protein